MAVLLGIILHWLKGSDDKEFLLKLALSKRHNKRKQDTLIPKSTRYRYFKDIWNSCGLLLHLDLSSTLGTKILAEYLANTAIVQGNAKILVKPDKDELDRQTLKTHRSYVIAYASSSVPHRSADTFRAIFSDHPKQVTNHALFTHYLANQNLSL